MFDGLNIAFKNYKYIKNFPIRSVKAKIRHNLYIMTSSIYIWSDYELNKHITCCVLSPDNKIIIIAQSGCHIVLFDCCTSILCYTITRFGIVHNNIHSPRGYIFHELQESGIQPLGGAYFVVRHAKKKHVYWFLSFFWSGTQWNAPSVWANEIVAFKRKRDKCHYHWSCYRSRSMSVLLTIFQLRFWFKSWQQASQL